MPELPDLQVFSANLTKFFKGRIVQKLNIINGKNLKDSPARLKKAIEGRKLRSVYRSGKELRFEFGDTLLGLHLMLHGNLHLISKSKEQKHTIVELHFDNNQGLAITDWQVKANVKLNPEDKKGVDALQVTAKYLQDKRQSKAIIKNLLMDQDVIRGIGNAYADEILWKSRISPFAITKNIPPDKIRGLAKNIQSVLKAAEKLIKKKEPNLITGEVRDFLVIHNSKKKLSPTGKEILVKNVGGRKTYFTEEQVLY